MKSFGFFVSEETFFISSQKILLHYVEDYATHEDLFGVAVVY